MVKRRSTSSFLQLYLFSGVRAIWFSLFVLLYERLVEKASVTKRHGIGPIGTEISPYKITKKMFIFQIVRFNGIRIWQNYFCKLPNFGDFWAKTSLFRYLINQKRNNFIKHCSPPCINKPPISEMYIYIRHNLYKWGLDTRGGTMFYRQKMGGGSA